MLLSILICTLDSRKQKLARLLQVLQPQVTTFKSDVNILINYQGGITIGEKRNVMVKNSDSEYICFVDDDDMVSTDYIDRIFGALAENHTVDCIGITGIISFDGQFPRKFYHTLQVDNWHNVPPEYFRTPNHLNPIKRELVLKTPFNSFKTFGEDIEFSNAIYPKLKTEKFIPEPIYYYLYHMKQGEVLP